METLCEPYSRASEASMRAMHTDMTIWWADTRDSAMPAAIILLRTGASSGDHRKTTAVSRYLHRAPAPLRFAYLSSTNRTPHLTWSPGRQLRRE
eukprot:m51a1_g12497 hypothetical protein (94) ;mRNA; f:2797-4410